MAIGAQNAFVLAQSLRREHHLPVAALCIVCDALLVAAGVFGLATLLAQSPTLLAIARWGGAAFLIWYGSQALGENLVDAISTSDEYILQKRTESDLFEVKYVAKKSLAEKVGVAAHGALDTVLGKWISRLSQRPLV